ncbi:MAG: adenylate kinase [Candidatus Nezhaarchaeales archaeon]
MRIILLGCPGSGKGTQAAKLSKELNVPHISTGDILREAVKLGTELGRFAKSYMNRGLLVPDDVIVGIIKERLKQPDTNKGFILDGFPRTLAQAEALNSLSIQIDAVIDIQVDDEEVIRRLSNRRTCKNCGAVYHLIFNPSKKPGVCDKCGGPLYQRDDDKEETIRNRLSVYKRQTKPLLNYYQSKGLLKRVNGNLTIDEVYNNIKKALGV